MIMCPSRRFTCGCTMLLWILFFSSQRVAGQDFGYDGVVGPSYWGQKYHQCVGKHQSPINIEEHNVEMVKLYPMQFENFDIPPEAAELKNNGHTVILTLKTENKPIIAGGPLLGRYEFAQLHFHWGSDDSEGSENKINNNSFPMELHMVFYQSAYGSVENAMEHPDGLTVLSFLYSNSEEENENYKPIIDVLPDLEESNTAKILEKIPTFDELIVQNRSVYFTYGGSLTTPPCSEVVTWIEFKNTIPLTHEQIEVFRHLKDEHGQSMSHNFRPTQPLYGRLIRMAIDKPELVKNEHLRKNSATETRHCATLTLFSLIIAISQYIRRFFDI